MRIKNGYAFQNSSTAGDNETVLNLYGGESLTVQVEGTTFSLSVEGCSEPTDDNFIGISGVDKSTLNVAKNITASGIYTFGIDGFHAIRFTLNSVSRGAVSVWYAISGGE